MIPAMQRPLLSVCAPTDSDHVSGGSGNLEPRIPDEPQLNGEWSTMLLHEALESLEPLGVHAETIGESPTSWRVSSPSEVSSILIEYLLLGVPGFRLDYVDEWEREGLLIIREH
jgi:hypothetical protein